MLDNKYLYFLFFNLLDDSLLQKFIFIYKKLNFVSSFSRTVYDNERGESVGESIIQSNAEKYRACEKFTFKCIRCKTDNIIAKPFAKIEGKFSAVLEKCANKECNCAPYIQVPNIKHHLSLAIRKAIRDYYDNWMVCNEPNCNQSTRTYVHVSIEWMIFHLWRLH